MFRSIAASVNISKGGLKGYLIINEKDFNTIIYKHMDLICVLGKLASC